MAGYTSINAVVKAELFPTRVRATGVGLPYAVTVSIFGGTAESIALWFKSIGHETWFYYYLTGVIATSLLVYVGDARHQASLGDGPARIVGGYWLLADGWLAFDGAFAALASRLVRRARRARKMPVARPRDAPMLAPIACPRIRLVVAYRMTSGIWTTA